MTNVFNGMFGKVKPGMCRLSMSGKIAIKTSNGYKAYDVTKNRLTNCDSFVFDIGEDMFFVIPTNKVEVGDIIIVSGKPRCVISVDKGTIKTLNYEDSTIEEVVPERHMFMGNTYFYGKIVSMFGNSLAGKDGANNMMKFYMMSQMMNGNGGSSNNLMPLMFMMNGGGNMFDNMFGDMFGAVEDETEEN